MSVLRWLYISAVAAACGEEGARGAEAIPLVEVDDPPCASEEVLLGGACVRRAPRVFTSERWGAHVFWPHRAGYGTWWFAAEWGGSSAALEACAMVGGRPWIPKTREEIGVGMHFASLASSGEQGSVWVGVRVDMLEARFRGEGGEDLLDWRVAYPPLPGVPGEPAEQEVADQIDAIRRGEQLDNVRDCLNLSIDGALRSIDCSPRRAAFVCVVDD